jgi:hypothetical protein
LFILIHFRYLGSVFQLVDDAHTGSVCIACIYPARHGFFLYGKVPAVARNGAEVTRFVGLFDSIGAWMVQDVNKYR